MTDWPFRFKIEHAIEATAILLRLTPGRVMEIRRLYSLLYLIDRQCLSESRRVFTGCRYQIDSYGPYPKEVQCLIDGSHIDVARWFSRFDRSHHLITMRSDPGCGHLSIYTSGAIYKVWQQANDVHSCQLSRLILELPDIDTSDGTQITLVGLLTALGRRDELAQIIGDAKNSNATDDFFRDTLRVT